MALRLRFLLRSLEWEENGICNGLATDLKGNWNCHEMLKMEKQEKMSRKMGIKKDWQELNKVKEMRC